MTRLALAFALLAAALGLAVSPAAASQPAAPAPALARVGSVPTVPKGAVDLGAAPAAARLRFDVVISPRDPSGLEQFATAVATPGNALYHQFLSSAEVTARFGPLASTVSAVTAQLTADGLSVGSVTPDRTVVSVSGTVAQVDSAFGASMRSYRLASGRAAIANTQAPTFPASLAGSIEGVVGLNTLASTPPGPPSPPIVTTNRRTAATTPKITGAPAPCSAASTAAADAGSYTANQLAQAYSLNGLYSKGDFGSGVTVAVFALGDEYNPSDISTYQTCYGTSATITNEPVDGATVTGTSGGTEFTLDLETLIGLAPKVKILAYDGVNGTTFTSEFTNWLDVEKRIVTDDQAKVVNESYGICEDVVDAGDPSYVTAENTNFEAAAAEGQSWLVSTGDTGAQGCDRVAGAQVAFGVTSNPEHMIGVDSPRHTSYVVNPTLGTVSVLDDEAQAIVATVPLGSSSDPDAIAVDSVNDKVFVDYGGGADLDEFDASTCNATTQTGCPTTAPAASADATLPGRIVTGHLSEAPGSKTPQARPNDLVLVNATDIAVNPSTGTVYVSRTDTSHATNYVQVINENTLKVVQTVQFAQSTATGAPKWDPANIAVDATASGNLYVTDLGGGSIFGINGSTCNAGNFAACGAWFDNLGNDFVPSTLVADPVSHRLFATVETSLGEDPGVVVVTSAGAGVTSIGLSEYISGLDGVTQIQTALSPSGNELLVTGLSAGNELEGIVVIPLSSLTITANVTLSQDCGIGMSNCDMTSMASDKTTGDVIVYSEDNTESPEVFLDFVPIDVPPTLNGLSPENPSTQPFVTAVGGTRLSAIGPAPTETPWNDPLDGDGAGTGGISQRWPMPAYQTGPGVINSLSSPNPCGAAAGSDCREVPDVSADADPETGYTLFIGGQWQGGEGGTSAAAPLTAATIALVESQYSPAPALGLLNPALYTLAAKGGEFNDITTGNDDYLGTGGGDYPATANYDMATGLGSPIATDLASGLISAPGAPTSPHATVGSATATVGWTAPTATGGLPITGYVVTPFVGTTAQTATTFSSTATTESVTGLTNGTTYTFKVAAVNKAGTGAQSVASAPVTVGAPNAPGLQSAQPGTTTAKVSWFPGANNGSAITGYTITPFLNGTTAGTAQTFNTTAANDTVTGLVDGSSYTFKIAAINARGTGLASNPTTSIKEGTPTAPALPSAQPGNTTAKLIWLASTANGSAVTGYVITPVIGTTAGTAQTFNSTATTESLSGLVNGTTYTFRIAAINANGTGPFSTTTAIKEGTPTAPPFPTAQPGSTTAKVTWFAATANASAITSYVVTPVVGTTVGTPQTFASTALSETVTGLVNGTTYTFRIAAVNGTGTGPFSTTAAIVEGSPGSPTAVKATAGTKQATVSWTAPANNGAAITGYVVTPFIGTVAQAAHTFTSTAVSEIITGLTTGSAYTFKVAAINSRGTGPTSAASTAVTIK